MELQEEQQLDAYWIPFTDNQQFKVAPKILTAAEGMYYTTHQGHKVLDGIAGHACVNAGHNRHEIISAIQQQAKQLDYAPAFKFGHQGAFHYSKCLAALAPQPLNKVFLVNSGSEAVDTALKMALTYQCLRGFKQRNQIVSRELSYHGAGFGGMSVSGMTRHHHNCTVSLPGIHFMPSCYDLTRHAFSRGQPQQGAERAEALEEIIQAQGAEQIAAVIIEPISVTAGVYIPPKGYLERIRQICDRHDILLIFDEVITGFGRLGANFAANYFGVTPDIITSAKAITNGLFPMGAVIVREGIFETFINKQQPGGVDFTHGYTSSGHPLGCAAGLANIELLEREQLFTRVNSLAHDWEQAIHQLAGLAYVKDIRNFGLLAAIELEPIANNPGKRGQAVVDACYQRGLLLRASQDSICLSPPLIIQQQQINDIVNTLMDVLQR